MGLQESIVMSDSYIYSYTYKYSCATRRSRMPFVSMRDLQRQASKVVDEATESGKPVVVTRNGKPVAILTAVDEEAFEDFVMVNLMGIVADVEEAYDASRDGDVRKANDVLSEIRAAG